jgi:hypothetical protein
MMPSRSRPTPHAVSRPVPALCEPLEDRRLLAADLVATEITGRMPLDLVDGIRPRIPGIGVNVINSGNEDVVRAPAVVRLFASADGVLDGTDTLLSEQTNRLVVRAGRTRHIPIKLRTVVPDIAEGSYRLLAVVDATGLIVEDNDANNVVASTGTVAIGPPFVSLTATGVTLPASAVHGRAVPVTLVVLNGGNVRARGTGTLQITFDLVSPGPDFTDTATVRINVRSRRTGNIRGRVTLPSTLAPGQYMVTATLTSVTGFTDRSLTDNAATNGPLTVR